MIFEIVNSLLELVYDCVGYTLFTSSLSSSIAMSLVCILSLIFSKSSVSFNMALALSVASRFFGPACTTVIGCLGVVIVVAGDNIGGGMEGM